MSGVREMGPDQSEGTAAPRRTVVHVLQSIVHETREIHMYIGGGILGTILVIVLILYLARRI